MDSATITGITLVVAVVVVFVVGLLSYVSSLVKNAYQIKVEMRSDMEAGLKRVEDDLNKKSKWMRSQLAEEVTKLKDNLEQDNARKLDTLQNRLQSSIQEAQKLASSGHQENRKVVTELSRRLASLEKDMAALKAESERRSALLRPRRGGAGTGSGAGSGAGTSPTDDGTAASPDSLAPPAPKRLVEIDPDADALLLVNEVSPQAPATADPARPRKGQSQRMRFPDFKGD